MPVLALYVPLSGAPVARLSAPSPVFASTTVAVTVFVVLASSFTTAAGAIGTAPLLPATELTPSAF